MAGRRNNRGGNNKTRARGRGRGGQVRFEPPNANINNTVVNPPLGRRRRPVQRDEDYTMGQLEALGLEALRLKCQDRRIPTNGKVRDLALRLYGELHPTLGETTTDADDEEVDDVLNNPPPEIIRAEDDVAENDHLPPNPAPEDPPADEDANDEEETLPYDEQVEDLGDDEDPPFPENDPADHQAGRQQHHEQQHQPQQHHQPQAPALNDVTNMVQAAVDTAMANTVRGLMEEIKMNQEKEATAAAEPGLKAPNINHCYAYLT